MKKIMAITLLLGAQSAFGMDADANAAQKQEILDCDLADYCGLGGTVEQIKGFIAKGANPNGMDHLGRPALVRTYQIHNHLAQAKVLLEAKATPNCQSKRSGTSPLMMAAKHGYPEDVKLLLDAGADVHTANEMGKTALDLATNPAVRALLEAKMQQPK